MDTIGILFGLGILIGGIIYGWQLYNEGEILGCIFIIIIAVPFGSMLVYLNLLPVPTISEKIEEISISDSHPVLDQNKIFDFPYTNSIVEIANIKPTYISYSDNKKWTP